jgi:2-iminoacetate synthase ThiH
VIAKRPETSGLASQDDDCCSHVIFIHIVLAEGMQNFYLHTLHLSAGINDWGGVSPITKDHVNPEKPWPHLASLAQATAKADFLLVPRLPVYPETVHTVPGTWLSTHKIEVNLGDKSMLAEGCSSAGTARVSVFSQVQMLADATGFARADAWRAGLLDVAPAAAKQSNAPDTDLRGLQRQGTMSCDSTTHQARVHQPGASAKSPGMQKTGSHICEKPATPHSQSVLRERWRVQLGVHGVLVGVPAVSAPPKMTELLGRVMALQERCLKHSAEERANCPAALELALMLTPAAINSLLRARGQAAQDVCNAADQLRAAIHGDRVSYVVNRNINYTNVCTYGCGFCAFSKGRMGDSLRGPAYLLDMEEIKRRVAEAWARGATEVCLQGGIHPEFSGETYLQILRACKEAAPGIHVHAFSPLEVSHGAESLHVSVEEFLWRLKDAGLGSLPGTAAEVLSHRVRSIICPDKLSVHEWLHVVASAHRAGLRTTSTIMFGHVDSPLDWASHLVHLR